MIKTKFVHSFCIL